MIIWRINKEEGNWFKDITYNDSILLTGKLLPVIERGEIEFEDIDFLVKRMMDIQLNADYIEEEEIDNNIVREVLGIQRFVDD